MNDYFDPRIDKYIASLPHWQQEICNKVRSIAHAADKDMIETVKRTSQPFFTLNGNVCALLNLLRDVIAHNRAGGWRKVTAKT